MLAWNLRSRDDLLVAYQLLYDDLSDSAFREFKKSARFQRYVYNAVG